jgi:hypothetical protein
MIVSQTETGWSLSVAAPPSAHADVWRAVLQAAEARLRTLDAPGEGPGPLLALVDGALRAGEGWDALDLPTRARLLDAVIERATLLLSLMRRNG